MSWPALTQIGDQFADAGEGALERIEAGELAADVDGDALHREARQRGGTGIGVERLADRNAELVLGCTRS